MTREIPEVGQVIPYMGKEIDPSQAGLLKKDAILFCVLVEPKEIFVSKNMREEMTETTEASDHHRLFKYIFVM